MYKITIIIPVYNVDKYLRELLESIVHQTMPLKDIQVIMVDDSSTDDSAKIMDEYAEKYDSFMSIKLKKNNKIAGTARNIGMKYAEGKYLMFADADDFYSKDACEILYNEIETKNADFVTANYINTDFDGTLWDKPVFDVDKYKDFKLSIYDYKKSFYILNSAVWNKIFRKDFVKKYNIKFLEKVPAEDAYFTTSCFMKSENVYYCNKVIYCYRQRNEGEVGIKSVSFNCSEEYFNGINKAYSAIYHNFKNNGFLAFYRFIYAKNMSYMLYKFIDSEINDEGKIKIMKRMKWFYRLSIDLKVPAVHKSQRMIIEKIYEKKYKEALNYCKIIADMRTFLPKEIKEQMSKPDAKMYDQINNYTARFEKKKCFRLKYCKMCDNSIFVKYGLKPVAEDYYEATQNMFCVADGVTRDTIHGECVPYPQNKEQAEEWVREYPNPSGAYEAAKICAQDFIKITSESEEMDEETILEIVKKVNNNIWNINEGRKIDYLAEDLYGCVAVGGYFEGKYLYAFSIGDCHIKAFDENFNLKFETINNHINFEKYLSDIYIKNNEYDWKKSKDRVMVRRDYRNKPDVKYNGEEVSFGVLTGEKEAEHYIDTYKIDLSNIKYICAYSDGAEPYFEKKETIKEIILNPSKFEKEGKERTLIIYEKRKI